MATNISQQLVSNNGYAPSVGPLPLDVWGEVAKQAAKVGANILESARVITSFLSTCRTLNDWKTLPIFTQLFQDARLYMAPPPPREYRPMVHV